MRTSGVPTTLKAYNVHIATLSFFFPSQEEQISQELSIDHRVHSRLIGTKGKAIAKVMERFSVDIRFPRDKGSDIITITGLEENVEDAKEHLLILTEDYVSV